MSTQSEEQKMLNQQLYCSSDPVLVYKRLQSKYLCHQLNTQGTSLFTNHASLLDPEHPQHAAHQDTVTQLLSSISTERESIYKKLFGTVGTNCVIESPFNCDYGKNTHLGNNVYMNFGCVILDCAHVRIGNDVYFGPHVQIYTAGHPLDPNIRRNYGPEFAKAITIQDDVWIGGNAVILPGVTIGNGSVVGGGSVVTKNVPPFTVVAGNPARVIRHIDH